MNMLQDKPLFQDIYSPIQPAVPQTDGASVSYSEHPPDARLRDFIYCYWQLKSTRPLSELFRYRVVSDGCTDIFFEQSNPEELFVMGFSTAYTEFPIGHSFHYIGIRFLPMAFSQIFRLNAHELTNHLELLNGITSFANKLSLTLIDCATSSKQLYPILDQLFLKLLYNVSIHTDSRVCNAVYQILRKRGKVRIEELDAGLSNRQLRRLFRQYVGTTPKVFSKVVRFQNVLRLMTSSRNAPATSFYYDPGYYDQPHFIRDFKTFYGTTPSLALCRHSTQ